MILLTYNCYKTIAQAKAAQPAAARA